MCQLACCKQSSNYEELFNLEILRVIYRVVCALFPCRPLGYLCVCIVDNSLASMVIASWEKWNCSTIANCHSELRIVGVWDVLLQVCLVRIWGETFFPFSVLRTLSRFWKWCCCMILNVEGCEVFALCRWVLYATCPLPGCFGTVLQETPHLIVSKWMEVWNLQSLCIEKCVQRHETIPVSVCRGVGGIRSSAKVGRLERDEGQCCGGRPAAFPALL